MKLEDAELKNISFLNPAQKLLTCTVHYCILIVKMN
jgi:hypothetical protein